MESSNIRNGQREVSRLSNRSVQSTNQQNRFQEPNYQNSPSNKRAPLPRAAAPSNTRSPQTSRSRTAQQNQPAKSTALFDGYKQTNPGPETSIQSNRIQPASKPELPEEPPEPEYVPFELSYHPVVSAAPKEKNRVTGNSNDRNSFPTHRKPRTRNF